MRVLAALVYYCLLTPLAYVLRAAGVDALRLRRDAGASTYWLGRR